MGVLGNYTMRRSPEGNDIAAHAKALRNWMRDGGWLLEGDKLAPDERAALIPYAYLFGALKSLGFGASADAEGSDAGDAAAAVRGEASMAAVAAATASGAPAGAALFLHGAYSGTSARPGSTAPPLPMKRRSSPPWLRCFPNP